MQDMENLREPVRCVSRETAVGHRSQEKAEMQEEDLQKAHREAVREEIPDP